MLKRLLMLVLILFGLVLWAVPQEWSVDVSRVQPYQFNAYHGETMELKASFFLRGQPYDVGGDDFALFWQTNGMGSAYWTAPATAASNTVSAVFTGAMDPGAPLVYGFLGSTGSNYRASFAVRFAASPGAVPNELPLPVETIDFAKVAVLNAPWATESDIDTALTNYYTRGEADAVASSIRESVAVAASSATNYTDSVAASLGALAWVDSVDWADILGKPSWIGDTKPSYSWSEILQRPATWDWSAISSKPTTLSGYGITDAISRTANTMTAAGVYTEYLINPSLQGGVRIRYSSTSDANQTTYMYSGVAARRNGATTDYLWDTSSESGVVRRSELSGLASSSSVSALDDDVSVLSNTVASIGAMLNAENARFVSTNYNSSTQIPEAYVEAKIDGSWLTIWSEMTRWNWLTDTYLPGSFYTKAQVNSALADKADRAWGFYDSHSGLYAPEGFTWVSSPKIAIAGGLAYSRTLTNEGAIWVLEANGMVAETGGLTNGFFRVSDDEGNALFEIVKGDKRTIGATANSVQVIGAFTPSKLQIGYAVQADAHPTLQITASLTDPDWYDEDSASCPANVTWSGVSGAYVATVQAKSASATQLFVKAEYQVGGETYIKNVGPISVDGGIYCTDNIHRVRPVYNNGTITWEVVQ